MFPQHNNHSSWLAKSKLYKNKKKSCMNLKFYLCEHGKLFYKTQGKI